MNIYLDINGVLLKSDFTPAPGAVEFLKHLTSHHECYWLSTYCRGGRDHATELLKKHLPASSYSVIEKVKPAFWQNLKTEGIDFNQDFRWFEDYPQNGDIVVLRQNKSLGKLIIIDLHRYPNQLFDFLEL